MPKLTAKQERFVQEYFKTSNQRKSYQHAYDAEGMSDNAVDREACLLLKNPKVAQRLAEMQERVDKKAEVTVETISDMLDQAFAKAAQDDKGSAAMVAAAMGKAKLHGLIVEKKEDLWSNPYNHITIGGSQAVDFVPFSSVGSDVISFK